MPLINSLQDVKRAGLDKTLRYRAEVIDNKDPKGLCRIRFRIPDFMDFPVDKAPWASAKSNSADGATPNSGNVDIPRIGSYVDIMFQGGSVYHPIYMGTSVTKDVQLSNSLPNYPDRKLIQLSNGGYVMADLVNNEVLVYNPGDFKLQVRGSINIEVDGNLTASVGGDSTIDTTGDVTVVGQEIQAEARGNVVVKAGGDVSVEAARIIALKGLNNSGDNVLSGIVTGKHICQVTGKPHDDSSSNVYAN